jgi:hypothetical protein
MNLAGCRSAVSRSFVPEVHRNLEVVYRHGRLLGASCPPVHFPTCTLFLLCLLSDISTVMYRCPPRPSRLLLIKLILRTSLRFCVPSRVLSARLHTTSLLSTMKAITFARNAGVEVVDLTPDLYVIEPASTDVVSKVAYYAGVNCIDT